MKNCPEAVRKHIYTTNIVENINSRIELVRMNTGGYFQSVKTAEVAIYVTLNRIEQTKWKNPMPLVKSALYDLRQMFNAKFLGRHNSLDKSLYATSKSHDEKVLTLPLPVLRCHVRTVKARFRKI